MSADPIDGRETHLQRICPRPDQLVYQHRHGSSLHFFGYRERPAKDLTIHKRSKMLLEERRVARERERFTSGSDQLSQSLVDVQG